MSRFTCVCGLDAGQCADSNMFPVIHKTVAQAGLAAVHDNSSNRKTLSAASVALTVVGNAPGCKLCGKIGLRQYDMDPHFKNPKTPFEQALNFPT